MSLIVVRNRKYSRDTSKPDFTKDMSWPSEILQK